MSCCFKNIFVLIIVSQINIICNGVPINNEENDIPNLYFNYFGNDYDSSLKKVEAAPVFLIANKIEQWNEFSEVPNGLLLKVPTENIEEKIVLAYIYLNIFTREAGDSPYIINVYGNYKSDDNNLEKRLIKKIESTTGRDAFTVEMSNNFRINLVNMIFEVQRQHDGTLRNASSDEIKRLLFLESTTFNPKVILFLKDNN